MPKNERAVSRRRGLLALVSCLTVLVTAGCASGIVTVSAATLNAQVPVATSPLGNVTWVIEAEPASLDPIYDYAYYDNTVVANMCEPLVRMTPSLGTQDWLATSHMVNPTTWTYDLRPGIKFWDGSPLTPADVVFSLGRNLQSSVGSYFSAYYTRVKSVTQTGPQQVTVKLTQPDALWNSSTIMTAGSYIVSKAFAERAGANFGSPGTGVMCTGPYKFGKWTPGASITLTRNNDYWNKSVAVRAPSLKFLFLSDSSAEANALSSGQAQGMYVRDPGILPQLDRTNGHIYLGPGLTYLVMSPTSLKSPLSDVHIRKALSLALDRDAIAKAVFAGAATPIYTLVGSDGFGANPRAAAIYQKAYDEFPKTKVDLLAARKLVQGAGSPTRPIVLAYPTEGGSYQLKVASVIQQAAANIGLNIVLRPLSPATASNYYEAPGGMANAGIAALLVGYNLNNADPFGMYEMFDPAMHIVDNYAEFSNPASSALLDQAASTYDDVERAKLTVEAQKIIMAQMPMIPIVSENAMVYMGPGVTGAPASFDQIWSSWGAYLGGTATGSQAAR